MYAPVRGIHSTNSFAPNGGAFFGYAEHTNRIARGLQTPGRTPLKIKHDPEGVAANNRKTTRAIKNDHSQTMNLLTLYHVNHGMRPLRGRVEIFLSSLPGV